MSTDMQPLAFSTTTSLTSYLQLRLMGWVCLDEGVRRNGREDDLLDDAANSPGVLGPGLYRGRYENSSNHLSQLSKNAPAPQRVAHSGGTEGREGLAVEQNEGKSFWVVHCASLDG